MKTNTRILAGNYAVSNDTRKTGLNNNDLIIGNSGAGKTGGYVVPNILNTDNESFIVADTKSQLYKMMHDKLKEKGYDVYVIDFVNPENSCTYNPLNYVRRGAYQKYRTQDVTTIVDSLVSEDISKHDRYWIDSAKRVLEFIICNVLEAFEPDDINLKTVIEIFKQVNSMESRKIAQQGIKFMEDWSVLYPNSHAYEVYRLAIAACPADITWAGIMGHASAALAGFTCEEMHNLLNGNDKFRIYNLGRKKCAVFLNISDTDRIISVIRSRDIYASIILQSLSQLEGIYGSARADTIVNNCDHIVYLGNNDLRTAQLIATRACRTPEAILQVEKDKAYIIERGGKAVLADKVKPYSNLNTRSRTKTLVKNA